MMHDERWFIDELWGDSVAYAYDGLCMISHTVTIFFFDR